MKAREVYDCRLQMSEGSEAERLEPRDQEEKSRFPDDVKICISTRHALSNVENSTSAAQKEAKIKKKDDNFDDAVVRMVLQDGRERGVRTSETSE